MYPHHYGSQLVHSPATPNSIQLFNSSPITSTTILGGGGVVGSNLHSSSSTSSPIRAAMKRSISDDSTDDDTMDGSSMQMADSNLDGSCHLMSRKKRRGLIEKRRRDRINNSLHELKRLVPAAFEKQGSAKLEKAEILQLTVDHLRMLHSKGFDAFSFDPHKFATDYHLIGFRECSAEIARYLVVHEGVDLQDPMRLRLISHLQCYSSQRELSLKSSTGWNPSVFTTPMYPPPPPPLPSSSSQSSSSMPVSSSASSSLNSSTNSLQQSVNSHSSSNNSNNNCDSMSVHNSNNNSNSHHNSYSSPYSHYSQHQSLLENSMMNSSMICNSNSIQPPLPSSSKSPNPMSSSAFSLGYSTNAPISSIPTPPASASSYPYSYPAGTYFGPGATYMTPMVPTSSNSNSQNSVKHYRPWGTELAY